MGLFSKKYDSVKDILRFVFDPVTNKYVFYKINTPISYDSLNRKSRKRLDEKNKELLNNKELLDTEIQYAKDRKRNDKLRSMGYLCDSFETLTNNKGNLSDEMEQYLNSLTSLDNVLLGIHRVGQVSDDVIMDILQNGLIMTGHLDSGVNTKIDLKQNVSYYPDNKKIIKELTHADLYKNSRGSILIKIPDCDLTGNIYVEYNGETRLNPKYILGYVPVEPNHTISEIITIKKEISYNPSYSYNYDYENELEETHRMHR